MNYKKREQSGWSAGKSYKGTRKAKEREHTKQEIEQQIDEQDDSFRYKPYTHTPNKKLSLEYSLKRYKARLYTTEWDYFKSHCRSQIQRIKKKLEKLKNGQ